MSISEPYIEALRLRQALSAKVTSTSPDRLAAVTILPQPCEIDRRAWVERWKPSVVDRSFVVLWREYSIRHLELCLDMAPGDGIWEIRRAEVVGEKALEELLEAWLVPVEDLDYMARLGIPE